MATRRPGLRFIDLRYGIISDIHGNLPALRVALAALRRQGIDVLVCAGDLIGYGPWPNECVAEIVNADALCVAGNQDLAVAGRLPGAKLSNHARSILEWTGTALEPKTLAFLAGLPLALDLEEGLRMAHGSLEDPERYIFRDEDAAQQLKLLGELHPSARSLILGHTHKTMAYGQQTGAQRVKPGRPMSLAGDRYLLNPGSVGQSRERRLWARLALLDAEDQQITFLALDYDIDLCRRELIRHGLPPGAYHAPPSLISLGRRFVRRVAHRSLRRVRKRSMT